MEGNGKVFLVGAGPSDAGLLTLRGLEILRQADTLVYDRLIGSGVLALLPPHTKKIDVGKQANHHPVPQAEICRILVREAQAGGTVVRLKGGDPFLFGRGGEELEALRTAGIPYEVVPGVSAAIAVPAYAGIPVTHRNYSSSLHIFTGHFSADKTIDLDFSLLAKLPGTLVFLMSVASAEHICRRLVAAGMPADMPAAAIQQGTTARQKTVLSTVTNLPARMQEIQPPAVLVIGRVAALASRFAWRSACPLDGKRIVVTRARAQCADFCAKIGTLGGEPIAFPCLETAPVPNGLDRAIHRLSQFTWITFSSVLGVECFFNALYNAKKDARALCACRIAAVGSATAAALNHHGLQPDLIPGHFDGGSLGGALADRLGPDDRVLIIRARSGARALEQHLTRAGIPSEAAEAYETRPPAPDAADPVRPLLAAGDFDWLTFASPSAVRGFAAAFPTPPQQTAVCIGDSTAAAAAAYGLHTVTADTATVDGMLHTMIRMAKQGL